MVNSFQSVFDTIKHFFEGPTIDFIVFPMVSKMTKDVVHLPGQLGKGDPLPGQVNGEESLHWNKKMKPTSF